MISNLPQQPPIASAVKARFVLSWWEREVHLWVLRKPAAEIFNSTGEDMDLNQNRKLLKTIVIKGDSNISSATINQEGTLLIVSTATDVKAFRLQHQDPVKPSDVKLSSIEVPQKLAKLGASQVELSPDSSWLCLVREGMRVLLARIESTEGGQNFFIPSNQIRRVDRLSRQIPRYVQLSGLGNYDRNITHAAFTPDSKMLATADLAGYIDTWILRSSHELQENGSKENESEEASSSESNSSESEDDDEKTGGQERWIRNPRGKLLPKLPNAPTVFSFSEDVPDSNDAGDYTLLVVTGSWNLHAFHPLKGALTPWSRRITRRTLPAPIQDLLDLPKGVVWQGSRAWIYGVSFLVMIDMSQEFPKAVDGADTAVNQVGLKRKRTDRTTGAGGKMMQSNLAPHQVSKHVDGREEDVDMDETEAGDESNSDDEMDDAGEELRNLRSNGDHAGSLELAGTGTQRKAWWMTFKYRPIFGIVPLEEGEVALVERPIWDVEMPERYFAGEAWER